MTITRTDVAAHLESAVKIGFLEGTKGYVVKRTPFCGVSQSQGAFETYAGMQANPWPGDYPADAPAPQVAEAGIDGRTGAPITNRLADRGSIPVLGGSENAQIVYNNEWPVAIGVKHTAINDNKVGGLEEWAKNVGSQYEKHKDWLAFSMLEQGDTNRWGIGHDGLTFFNDAHITPKAPYQVGQDNNFSVGLAADPVVAFNTVKVAGSMFVDEAGKPAGLSHNLLVVSSSLEMAGAQVTQNREVAGTTNRDSNPYAGNVKMIVAPGGFLDTTSWFTIDNTGASKPIYILERMAPTLVIEDDNIHGVRYFIWNARYAGFYGNWRLAVRGQ